MRKETSQTKRCLIIRLLFIIIIISNYILYTCLFYKIFIYILNQ